MQKYFVTAFSKEGKHLLNEAYKAQDDREAKELGIKKLEDKNLGEATSRIVRSSGGLVHFHQ